MHEHALLNHRMNNSASFEDDTHIRDDFVRGKVNAFEASSFEALENGCLAQSLPGKHRMPQDRRDSGGAGR